VAGGVAGKPAAFHKGIVQTVQLAGRRAMDIEDFLPGQPDFIGSELI